MMLALIQFSAPMWLKVAAVALVGVATALFVVGNALPRSVRCALIIGAVLIVLAAMQPRWDGSAIDQPVTVMVDLSPSTRTAHFRDPAQLQRRINQLLGDHPYRLHYFADQLTSTASDGGRLADIPSFRTRFLPPAGGPILLFSDGQFEPPATAPPVFVAVDIGLDKPNDARVASLHVQDATLTASVVNRGPTRALHWHGAGPAAPQDAATGAYALTAPRAAGATQVAVQLAPGDAWPENDALTAIVPPPVMLERWWVGGTAPTGWIAIAPATLLSSADLLRAGVIALHNLPADELSTSQQSQLQRYVSDMGGTLIILGGNRAFAAGGYAQTTIGELSPLASHPPRPTMQWVLLADASGSMAAATPNGTRFALAVGAMKAILASLPADDPVAIGAFAGQIGWWSTGKSVRDTPPDRFPPADFSPSGPTNLAAALSSLADDRQPRSIFLITDGGSPPIDVATLSEKFRAGSSSIHVLAIGTGPAMDSLKGLAKSTNGQVLAQDDPAKWPQAARALLGGALPMRLETERVQVKFSDMLTSMQPLEVSPWNRTWLKDKATALAATAGGSPMAAWWQVGNGRVAATAFDPPADVIDRIVARIARPPHDDRFSVQWTKQSANVAIGISAVDQGQPINRASLSLTIAGQTYPVPQLAPGEYGLRLDAPRQPTIATIQFDGVVIDRHALPGHYPAEFNGIGNDYAAMHRLADQTGGRLIGPADQTRIQLPRKSDGLPLTPWLAALGALGFATGLVMWRRK
jgi:hypothetical protein